MCAVCSVIFVDAQSFSSTSPISVAPGLGSYHPQIEVLNDGKAGVLWTDFSDKNIYFAKHDGSNVFETPIQLNPAGFDIQSYTWSGPDLSTEGDKVYVVFRSDGYETGHIYVVKSNDNGATFGDTVRVDQNLVGFGQYPDIAVLNDTVWVTFMDHDAGGLDPQYVVARSADGGQTFDTEVSASSLWGAEACDCCQPEIIVNDNKVIVLFRNNDSNTRDIKAVVSNDRGATFTDMFSVDDHNWVINSCPSTGPDARFLSDDIVVAAYKTSISSMAEIYVNQYNLQSGSSDALVQLMATGAANQQLNFPQLDTKNGVMGVVWEGSGQSLDVFMNTSSSGASGLNPDNAFNLTEAGGVQSKPDIAVGDGFFHVVYADNSDLVYVQVTPLLSVEKENAFEIEIYPIPAKNMLKITSDLDVNEVLDGFEVFNMMGQKLDLDYEVKGPEITVDIEKLAQGNYQFVLKTKNGMVKGKFIKE